MCDVSFRSSVFFVTEFSHGTKSTPRSLGHVANLYLLHLVV